jgi:hypothetical protein
MNRALSLFALMPLLLAAKEGEQCEWPFVAAPAQIGQAMKANAPVALKTDCPAKSTVTVRFGLDSKAKPINVSFSSPECAAAARYVKSWIADRPAAAFLDYAGKGPFDFSMALKL